MRKPILVSLPVIALILFAVPSRFEGPVLIPISPGHGLSLVDIAAVIPLIAALTALGVFLVRRRASLERTIRQRPWVAATVLFVAAFGLGLLFASVFPFFWWWAVGAALATLALVVAALAAGGRVSGPSVPDAHAKG
jgi:FtsH-binding integral membrane protein